MHRSSRIPGRGQKLFCLLAGAAIAFACCDASISARAQTPKSLKLGYILSTDSQLGAGGTVFADEIAKRTQGRYRIEQYPNSALGGEVEMLKAVQLGTVDLAFITGAPLPNFMPDIGVFNIPFLFPRPCSRPRGARRSNRAVLFGEVSRKGAGRFGVGRKWNAAHNQFQT